VTPNFASGSPAANGGLFSPYNLNGVLLQRRYDIALFAFSEPPDPQSTEDQFNPSHIPTAAEHAGADQNYNGITDKDQFNLLVKARSAVDVSQRKSLFNQWQKLENQRVYWIMLYARTNITADDGKIGNYIPNPSSAGNSWNSYQWYSKAS
jgi:peptide/nickel transport system substrate-binding protein